MLLSSNPKVRATQPRSGGVDVVLSTHALMRFCTRSGRELSAASGRAQLAGMWEHVEIVASPPEWVREHRDGNPFYAVIADVVFPLRPIEDEPNTWIACTAIFKGVRPQRSRGKRRKQPTEKRRKRREPRPRIEEPVKWAA